jgi:hypothetical protein
LAKADAAFGLDLESNQKDLGFALAIASLAS